MNNSTERKTTTSITLMLLFIVSGIFKAFILLCLIGWFATIIGTYIPLTIPSVMGVGCVITALRYSSTSVRADAESIKASTDGPYKAWLIYEVIIPALMLVEGYIISLFLK